MAWKAMLHSLRKSSLGLLSVLFSIASASEPAPLATVDLFIATDCPIANGLAPEIERIHQAYKDKGVVFRLVYPDRDLTEEAVKEHLADYGLSAPFVIDRDHRLVKRAAATTTPEVVVFDAKGILVYRGRIDDRYTDLGARRNVATEFYLRDALEAVLSGKKPLVEKTVAIGCLIETVR